MTARNILMAAGGASAPANYIEDVFSTWLYAGNGASRTITTGIDVSGKGGLVWVKGRDVATQHILSDSVTGAGKYLSSNSNHSQTTNSFGITSFTSTGFGITSGDGQINASPYNYVAWTFRKQPKFFDVVTYTGNGSGSDQVISHNLGSTPGCIIVKCTSNYQDWLVWHRATGNSNDKLFLNLTDAKLSGYGNGVQSVTSTSFVAAGNTTVTNYDINVSGRTYVAYLFAHNAGGFGLSGADNVISCGSFTTDGSGNATVNLGYEPQWVLFKSSSNAENWYVVDNMRGFPVSGDNKALLPNLSNTEGSFSQPNITNTGFAYIGGNASRTYIYIAIRRGPMKIPTSGSEVFLSQFYYGQSEGNPQGFIKQDMAIIPDTVWIERISGGTGGSGGQGFHGGNVIFDRSRSLKGLYCARYNNTPPGEQSAGNTGVLIEQNSTRVVNVTDGSSYDYDVYDQSIGYQIRSFKRSRNVFETVYYTGNSTNGRSVVHNLGVAPELMLVKKRTYSAFNSSVSSTPWAVYYGNSSNYLTLDTNEAAATSSSYWNNTSPTLSSFTLGNNTNVNLSNDPYVAYLFSTLAGVSKVGTYTGNGSSQTINCGFSAGARFILIKRIDSTGSWYVFDSARGIVSGNDPYFTLNTNEAEFPYLDVVDPASSGFIINQESTTNLNVTSASYVYLAIA